ncbi:class I SAM-dependent methyltransferase [Thiohalophilus thiocyanatoxydans]|uniref:Methyltransferase family protein n=1 Tax=Thiohalophilus thiocyanatoxydans TaxID=381308 RepID=A0A4R8IZ05_9GAMM|nr:methyltransferase domain-containing protein [Thiohalophilus thiocyanatoxydans]TDY02683.1 methyltransferase family protein [Thiohalophilus thiocyanatoxydans]
MRKSSSWHSLNADRGLSKIEKIRWMIYNIINNSMPQRNLDPNLNVKTFDLENPDHNWQKVSSIASPARRMSDFFWLQLPWEQLAMELGSQVSAVEVGCGSGRYGSLLKECLGDKLIEYIGIDIKPHKDWRELSKDNRFKFVVGDSSSMSEYLQSANLIITQSALEHFDEDLTFFRQISDYINSAGKPVIQVHLMPSAGCQMTFLWHGVRHYTPRTVSKITKIFDSDTVKTLYSLGSRNCNRVHRRFITIPRRFGKGDQRECKIGTYQSQLHDAIERDLQKPKKNEACFYALLLQSNVMNPLAI